MPSELKTRRQWRTRQDPFEEVWPQLKEWLTVAPELEAKTLFEFLQERHPGRFQDGQLRTLQRRIADWRILEGPDKEVFFGQDHRPGERFQLDFCSGDALKVTINGEPFEHLLCQVVLPYSNWQHATSCRSESTLAIRQGLQQAVRKLGHVAKWVQTDNSSAATHRPGQEEELPERDDGMKLRRPFNPNYEHLIEHLGMRPRTIAVGKSEQNGDVEALNRRLRSRLHQYLEIRGSRDFESREAYDTWRGRVLDKANEYRHLKVREELRVMNPLRVRLLPEYNEEKVRVLTTSTISIDRNTYSVPSRLIRSMLTVHLYEDHLKVFCKGQLQFIVERLTGRGNARIDYRHIIHSLVRKPGAFARYRYREQLFPSLVFRRAYDALCERMVAYKADVSYLSILKLAAETMQCEVEAALELLLEAGAPFGVDTVRELVGVHAPTVPQLAPLNVNLGDYDSLLDHRKEVAA